MNHYRQEAYVVILFTTVTRFQTQTCVYPNSVREGDALKRNVTPSFVGPRLSWNTVD